MVKIFPLKFERLSFFILFIILFSGNAFSQTEFIENKGQWDKQVKFMSNAGNGAFFLQNNGFTVVQHDATDLQNFTADVHGENKVDNPSLRVQKIMHSHAYNVQFIGAEATSEIIPDKPLPSVNNYFIGDDKSKWASNCKIYGGVTYKNVYPNIDVRYYSDAGSHLKYDFIIHPGGDINNIALKYKGANGLLVKNKELIIKTSIGENRELYPYTYQVINNERKERDAKYIIEGDVVKFKIKDYSLTTTLIIDPSLIFFTYSGSTTDNWGFTATYGPDGSFYSGGIAFGNGFPVSPGAYSTNYNTGAFDIAILKLTPDGKNRVYATYIGGNGEEQPHSLVVDPQGNLIIAGRTNSDNYPVTVPKIGPCGGWDIIVTKLNATGSNLIGSIKIGGTGSDGVNIRDKSGTEGTLYLNRNYGDDARSEVIIDAANNIYVASSTQSTGSVSTRFPTTAGVFQPNPVGNKDPSINQDGVVIKLNPNCNSLIWSTYLAGSDNDAAYVLALGNNNNLYVGGGTASNDLAGISSSGTISSSNSGECDGFIVELSNDGSNALHGTYLGTNMADQVYGIQTDKAGNVYAMGTTEGQWKLVLPPPAITFGPSDAKQFISKLDPNLNAYIYSTVFGTGSTYPNISPTAFLVDRCENVYVSGWGGKASTNLGYHSGGTTKDMPITPSNAIRSTPDPANSDFYFIVIRKNADSLLYGSFFGEINPVSNTSPSNFGDHVDGGTSRFDKNGYIYQAMCANCGKGISFPGTPGSWSSTNAASTGSGCSIGMVKINMNFAGVEASPRPSINGVINDSSGCVPFTVRFDDILQKGKTYIWDYGDNSPKDTTSNFNVLHTYTTVGYFLVTLIAIDPKTCNVADTAYLHIKAGNNKATLDFIPNKTGLCTDLSYIFTNTSSATFGTFKSNSFIWDFGDNTSRIPAGLSPVTHTYSGPGTYKVKLILNDTTYCNNPDSIIKTIRLSPIVKAQFNTPAEGCVPYNALFDNTSAGGLNFFWDFGDGTTSTLDNPTHLYSAVGSYTITLYAFDSTSCNKKDSTTFTITVSPIPVAAFTFTPDPPLENTFTQFANQSTGATKYLWAFGDGDSSTEANPKHLYNATGTYNVCLSAINNAGCSDSICMPVKAIINPLLDVPNAFTPGKFGINGIVRVVGFGIKEMNWIIYNRWGQKVFQSTSKNEGWNGYYKGKLQPMDVYTYTLDVTFSDGTKTRKAGDITLIR